MSESERKCERRGGGAVGVGVVGGGERQKQQQKHTHFSVTSVCTLRRMHKCLPLYELIRKQSTCALLPALKTRDKEIKDTSTRNNAEIGL